MRIYTHTHNTCTHNQVAEVQHTFIEHILFSIHYARHFHKITYHVLGIECSHHCVGCYRKYRFIYKGKQT